MAKWQIYGTIGAMVLTGAIVRNHQGEPAPAPDRNKQSRVQGASEIAVSGEGPWIASCHYWSAVQSIPRSPTRSSPELTIQLAESGDKFTSTVVGAKDKNPKDECEKSGDEWGIPAVRGSKAIIRPEIHALVAAVPDPVHSHLALEFDRAIDALVQAAADHQYLASYYWLPWRNPTSTGGSEQLSSSDQTKERNSQLEPGLIILKFSPSSVRGSSTPEGRESSSAGMTGSNVGETSFYRVIYLFLVGESPALGMNGAQLRNALRYEDFLRERYYAKLTMADPARITGPLEQLFFKSDAQTKSRVDRLLEDLQLEPSALNDNEQIRQVKRRATLVADPTLRTKALAEIDSLNTHNKYVQDYFELAKVTSILNRPYLSSGDVENVQRAIDHLFLEPESGRQAQDSNYQNEIARLKDDVVLFKNHLASVAFIGPRSSGSATSMRQALLCAPFASPPAAFIGAGTTSTTIAAAELNESNPWGPGEAACSTSNTKNKRGAKAVRNEEDWIAPASIHYLSFGENTGYEEKQLIESFQSTDTATKWSDTAILAEDSTVFGGADVGPSEGPSAEPSKALSPKALYIRFPRELSLLRNARTDQGNASSQTPSPYLSFSLRDPGSDDMIPNFSSAQTPLSREAQLMDIERQLQKNHIRHILITASNILDEIFLARELHRACPDASIVFYNGGDLLVERDIDNTPYIGSLTVTPYSLVALDSPTKDSRRVLSDSQEAAVYNAASYVFWWGSADSQSPPRLTSTFHSAASTGNSAGNQNSKSNFEYAPLYVDAIGSDGYYPLGILNPCASDSQWITPKVGSIRDGTGKCDLPDSGDPRVQSQGISAAPSLSWLFICGFITLLCFIHGAAMVSANYWSPLTRDLDVDHNDQPRRRAVYIHIGTSMLCCSALVIVIPYIAFARIFGIDRFACAAAVLVLAAALFAVIATLSRTRRYIAYLKLSDPRYSTELYPLFNFLAFAIVPVLGVIMAGVCFYDRTSWGNSNVGLFFSYRCLHPISGVSPLVPLLLLLLAWYLWAVFQTARLRFSEMNRPRLPSHIDSDSTPLYVPDETLGTCSPPLASCLTENIDCLLITRELARRFTRWNSFGLNMTLGVFYVAMFLVWSFELHIQSFDHFLHPRFGLTAFEWLTAILFYPLIMIALSAWMRVLLIWNSLRNGVLEPLERSPLRRAFNRLNEVSWIAMLAQSGLNIRWRDMVRSLESVRQLLNTAELRGAKNLRREYDELQGRIKNLRRHIELSTRDLDGERKVLEEKKSKLELESEGFRENAKELEEINERLEENGKQVKEKDDLSQGTSCSLNDPAFLKRNPDLPRPENAVDLFYMHDIEQSYAAMGKRLLQDVLIHYWNERRTGYVASSSLNVALDGKEPRTPELEEPTYICLAEEFLAIRYVALIRTVLVNIHDLMLFVSLAFVFAIVAWNSYPFQPHEQIDLCFTVLMILLTIGFVTVFAQMHRNAILSRITSTKPNELGMDFYLRLLTFGAVPVLTWLAYQFPSIGSTLFRILQPSLQVK